MHVCVYMLCEQFLVPALMFLLPDISKYWGFASEPSPTISEPFFFYYFFFFFIFYFFFFSADIHPGEGFSDARWRCTASCFEPQFGPLSRSNLPRVEMTLSWTGIQYVSNAPQPKWLMVQSLQRAGRCLFLAPWPYLALTSGKGNNATHVTLPSLLVIFDHPPYSSLNPQALLYSFW